MIHFVHLSSTPGGIEVLMPEIIRNLPGHECRSFVVRPHPEGKDNVYEGTGIPVTYGDNDTLKAAWKLWRYARRHRKDIFHVFNLGPYFTLALRLAGVRNLVYSVRGTIYWKTKKQKLARKPFWKLALRRRYRVIANSQYSRDRFVRAIGYRREIPVVYNPLNERLFSPAASNGKTGRRIIYCGRLTHGKNLFLWLELAAEIHNRDSNTSFHLYGAGPLLGALRNYANELGIGDVVHFMGFTRNIVEAYQSADVLLFLSEYESFGNVAVESILCGTPVLVSDIPSMREIFENYPEFIVPLKGGLKGSILSKIDALPELKAKALLAREEFSSRFGVGRHIEALENTYEQFQ